jgi:hypothetical protein
MPVFFSLLLFINLLVLTLRIYNKMEFYRTEILFGWIKIHLVLFNRVLNYDFYIDQNLRPIYYNIAPI